MRRKRGEPGVQAAAADGGVRFELIEDPQHAVTAHLLGMRKPPQCRVP